MSHFAGLVILTPEYEKHHDIEDALEKYDENLEVDEYSRGEVSDSDIVSFLTYYSNELTQNGVEKAFIDSLPKDVVEKEIEELLADGWEDRQIHYKLIEAHSDEYCKWFKENHKNIWDDFKNLYEENGDDWNGGVWRINYATGKLEEYSTYNPDSKWDWYDCCGRWSGCLKTKSGEYVNDCLFEEIDWSDFNPEDYEEEEKTSWNGKKYHDLKEGIRWHFTKSELPFCFIIDGEWVENGSMGWWGMTSNEMGDEDWNKKFFEALDRLPKNSYVSCIDFHI